MQAHDYDASPPLSNAQDGSDSITNLPICHYRWIGSITYQEARQLQEDLALQIARGEVPPTLLLIEHPHTFTLGRSSRQENLLWDAATQQQRCVSVLWIDRGGDITYHGPGQLIGYPLLALGKPTILPGASRLPQADYIGYLRALEEMLILALLQFGVHGMQVAGKTGVWVQHGNQIEKIASIGVKVDSKGITRHGFALNVAPDMSYWSGIVPCGLPEDQITSLATLLPSSPPMQQVIEAVIDAFRDRFHYHMVKYT